MARPLPKIFFEKSNPRVFVAGGAGFIGSHLCEELIGRGCEVFCLDNWQTGIRENIEKLRTDPNFHLIELDITAQLPKDLPKPDYIFHVAAAQSYLADGKLSLETLLTNSRGTENLLNLAEKTKARFLLLSTVDVLAARASLTELKNYFGKTESEVFAFDEAKRFAEALVAEFSDQRGIDARVVRVWGIFGPRMALNSGSLLANLIRQAVYSQDLEVPYPGNQKIFPLYITDAVREIVGFMFSPGTGGKIFYLVGSPLTIFEFAREIGQLAGKRLEIKTVERQFLEPRLAESVDFTPTDVREGLRETLVFFEEHKSQVPKPPTPKEEKTRRVWWPSLGGGKRILAGILAAAFLILALPVLQLLLGLVLLLGTRQAVSAGQLRLAQTSAQISQSALSAAKRGFARFGILPLVSAAETLEFASRTAQKAGKVASLSQSLINGVLGDAPYDINSLSRELSLGLSDLSAELGFLQAQTSEANFVALVSKAEIARWREILFQLSKISHQLPEILGVGERRTYLILFQNNMELRPTGGFIGSYGLLTLESGRLVDLQVADVYQADGQLVGHVEPPGPIKNYLGEGGWYLRDSNWDPDFSTSAVRAAWFLDKELGVSVDGVVGIDLEFAKKLVARLGRLEIADFAQEITADNLYERTQYHAEANFFPGSQQKQDFLTALSRALLLELTSQKPNWAKVALAIFSSAEERHLQIYLSDRESAEAIASLLWDGGVRSVSCSSLANCQAASVLLVEANLGVNKANYFLQRTSSLNIFVSGQKTSYQLDVTYTNNSEGDTWPGGPYKNYMRILVPQGAEPVSAKLVDQGTGESFELPVQPSEEKGFSVFGFLLEIPAGSSRRLEFSWQTETKLNLASPGQLLFFWQKQAGIGKDPVFLRFHFPAEVSLKAWPDPSLTEQGIVSYNTTSRVDIKVELLW